MTSTDKTTYLHLDAPDFDVQESLRMLLTLKTEFEDDLKVWLRLLNDKIEELSFLRTNEFCFDSFDDKRHMKSLTVFVDLALENVRSAESKLLVLHDDRWILKNMVMSWFCCHF